jgi:hypothetical protein
MHIWLIINLLITPKMIIKWLGIILIIPGLSPIWKNNSIEKAKLKDY